MRSRALGLFARRPRNLAILVVLALLVASIPAFEWAARTRAAREDARARAAAAAPATPRGTTDAPPTRGVPSVASGGATRAEVGDEVPSLRTESSRTFRTPDGQLQAVIWPGAVNYRDAKGAWRPIDNTLVASDKAGYAWRNKADAYSVQLPSQLGAAPVRIEHDDAWLSFQLAGTAPTTGSVRGNAVTYADVLPGVSVAYAAANGSVKESLVLANASVPTSYSFDVRTSPGLSLKPNGSGGLNAFAGPAFKFALPAPFLQDATGGLDGFSSRAVSYRVARADAGYRLSVDVDPTWLRSPTRKWPVVLDPTVTLTGPAVNADCHIVGGNFANQGFCASDELEVGSSSTGHRHGLLYFPVEGALPRDSVVVASKVSLYVPRAATNGALTVGLRQLTNPFTSDATWVKRNATTNWTTAGGDYLTTTIDSQSAGAAAGWVDFAAHAVAQRWVNGETRNDGFLLRRQIEDATQQLVRFISRNSTDSVHWPTMTIAYEARYGLRDAYTFDTKNISDRSELNVNVANGNLVVGATDLNIRGVGMDLVVNRTYNGLAEPHIGVGRAWHTSIGKGVHLTAFPSGTAVLQGSTGERIPFIPTSANPDQFTAVGVTATLDKSVNGSTTNYVLTWHKTGEIWRFSRTGSTIARLDKQEDRNGNRLEYTYDGSDRLTQIKQLRRGETGGRTVTATYVGSSTLIDRFTDPSGRTVIYGYTGNELTSVTDADSKITRYEYTGDKLTKITDARNNVIDIVYETGTRRVASVTRVTASTSDTDPKSTYTYTGFSGSPLRATSEVTDANNHKTTYSVDTRDRVRKTTDALGHAHEGDYDSADNVTFLRDGLTNQTSFQYSTDGKNNLTSSTEANGASTQFTYGDLDNSYAPDTKTDSSANKTTYAYTAPGNLTGASDSTSGGTGSSTQVARHTDGTIDTLTDANNRVTDYTYTYSSGLLTKLVVTPPTGSTVGTTTTNFDSLGRVSSVVDGKGQTRSFTYDKIDRTKSETVGSLSVTRTYDANGNLTQVTDPTGTTIFTYDELNRNLTKAAPSRPTITYAYDGVGNLKTLTDAGGQVGYRYDAANRMDQITEPGSKISTFGYDNADRRTSVDFPNGVDVTIDYDKGGRQNRILAVKASTTIVDLKYCYKKVAITDTAACTPSATGNTSTRYKVTDSRLSSTTNYAYDTMSRLKQAKTVTGGTDDFQYAYDKTSNRTKQVVTQGGSTTTTFFGYGPSNELCWSKVTTTDPGSACATPSGATTFNHDANGNMTSSSAGFSATYNPFDQATSITASGGSALTPMTYGGSDQTERRRAGPTNFTDSALGLQVAAPTSGGTGTFYTRDQSGNLISQRTPSGTHYYILDALGSVVALTKDTDGSVVGRYGYEPYGKPTHSGTVTSNFQFASGFYDSQTKLVKFGARYFDPALGRWTQRDPIAGQLADPRTLNRYAYSNNDPINTTDPTGLITAIEAIVLGLATISLIGATVALVTLLPTATLAAGAAAMFWFDISALAWAFSYGCAFVTDTC